MAVNYKGSSVQTVFTTLVLMTGITAALTRPFCALAQTKKMKRRRIDLGMIDTPRFVRGVISGAVTLSILFIQYACNNANDFWISGVPFFLAGGALLLGSMVYLSQKDGVSQPSAVPPIR